MKNSHIEGSRRAAWRHLAACLALLSSASCTRPADTQGTAVSSKAQAGSAASKAQKASGQSAEAEPMAEGSTAGKSGGQTAAGAKKSASGQSNAADTEDPAAMNTDAMQGAAAGSPASATPSNMRSSGAAGSTGATPAAPQKVTPACMDKAMAYACEGSVLYHCTEQGGYDMRRDCMSAGKCGAGVSTGMCGLCEPGAARCSGAVPEICDAMGTWVEGEPCASAKLCNPKTGMCDAGACSEGEYRCNGDSLETCATDLTEFKLEERCEAGLCNAEAMRCYECKPGSKVCAGGSSLNVCSTEGMLEPQSCSGDTPFCEEDSCVQCRTAADCKSSNECMEPSCTAGKCGTGTPKPRKTACSKTLAGGAGVCDLTGSCVTCVDDTDCHDPSKRCNPLNLLSPCESRSPLEVTPSLLGNYSVTVAPGFVVDVVVPTGLTITINYGTVPCALGCSLPAAGEPRTYSFSGPACSSSALPPIQTQTAQATLAFGGETEQAACRMVQLSAKAPGK